MTDYQKYINALRKCANEHENDRTSTGHIRVSDLCRNTANLLEELSCSEKSNNSIRYIILQVQKDSYTACHGIFNDFYKAVGKCVCLIGDSDDRWLENDYKITDRSDMWKTETENGFGWYRKYVHENPKIVIEETWLVINGDVEE